MSVWDIYETKRAAQSFDAGVRKEVLCWDWPVLPRHIGAKGGRGFPKDQMWVNQDREMPTQKRCGEKNPVENLL